MAKTYWEVTYEVREIGSIGIFYPMTHPVVADSPESAREAFRAALGSVYEMRNPIKAVARFGEPYSD